jgi:shikimate kinase
VGRRAAERASRSFLDVDVAIEQSYGQPIASIFADRGEPAFRDLEEQVLRRLLTSNPGAVVATGGGAVLRLANRSALWQFGFVVWLDAPADLLADRLARDPAGRPALTGHGLVAEVAVVLEARRPSYNALADSVVSVAGKSVEELAEEVLCAWASWNGRMISGKPPEHDR